MARSCLVTRLLSPVNRHHDLEPATSFATLSFPDRDAYFCDKVVSRLRSLPMIYRNSSRIRVNDRVNARPRRGAREDACRGQDAEQITPEEDFCILIYRTQLVHGDGDGRFLFSTVNDASTNCNVNKWIENLDKLTLAYITKSILSVSIDVLRMH